MLTGRLREAAEQRWQPVTRGPLTAFVRLFRRIARLLRAGAWLPSRRLRQEG